MQGYTRSIYKSLLNYLAICCIKPYFIKYYFSWEPDICQRLKIYTLVKLILQI